MLSIESKSVTELYQEKIKEIEANPEEHKEFIYAATGRVLQNEVFKWAQQQKYNLFEGCDHQDHNHSGYYNGPDCPGVSFAQCARCNAVKTGSQEWRKSHVY